MTATAGIVPLAATAVAIGFEIYPGSAVISRIAAPGEQYISYYSYFSVHNFWLGNIFPLITAVMTCVTAVILLLQIFAHIFPNWVSLVPACAATFFAYKAMRAQYYQGAAACILAILCLVDILIVVLELKRRIGKHH